MFSIDQFLVDEHASMLLHNDPLPDGTESKITHKQFHSQGVHMRNLSLAIMGCLVFLAGCSSPAGMGVLGGVLGAGAAGGGYEYHLKRQKDRVEEDLKAGKIEQKEYEIRKDQIARDSLLQ